MNAGNMASTMEVVQVPGSATTGLPAGIIQRRERTKLLVYQGNPG